MGVFRQIFFTYRAREKFDCERGASFVEGAMVLPLLIFLAFGAIEIGRALNQYVNLVSIAEEGARVGSRIAGVSPGTLISSYDPHSNTTTVISASPNTVALLQSKHIDILNKVTPLIQLNQENLSVTGIQIQTRYIRHNSGGGVRNDSLSVNIRANYVGLFRATNFVFSIFGLQGLPIRTEAIGPYIDQRI